MYYKFNDCKCDIERENFAKEFKCNINNFKCTLLKLHLFNDCKCDTTKLKKAVTPIRTKLIYITIFSRLRHAGMYATVWPNKLCIFCSVTTHSRKVLHLRCTGITPTAAADLRLTISYMRTFKCCLTCALMQLKQLCGIQHRTVWRQIFKVLPS